LPKRPRESFFGVELLRKKDWKLIAAFKSKYIDLLRKYYYVGGMPEAVDEYIQTKDAKTGC